MQKPTRPPVKNESAGAPKNRRGTLAMARTQSPDSATAQFYINLRDNAALDARPGSAGYTVVGEVVEGMDVVDKIAKVTTDCPSDGSRACSPVPKGGLQDVPSRPVLIKKAARVGR